MRLEPGALIEGAAEHHGPEELSVVLLAALSELAGALGPSVGASRRYDGPLGKSDRALVFGALGLWVGLAGALPGWAAHLMPLIAALLVLTLVRRVRAGIAEAEA